MELIEFMKYYQNSLCVVAFILLLSREANLIGFTFESLRLIDLMIIFCTNIIIRPNPNSTADNIKKKNVKDSKFKLS